MIINSLQIIRMLQFLSHVACVIIGAVNAFVCIGWGLLPRQTTVWINVAWLWNNIGFWRVATVFLLHNQYYTTRKSFCPYVCNGWLCFAPTIDCPKKTLEFIDTAAQYQFAMLVVCMIVIVCQYRMLQTEPKNARRVPHMTSRQAKFEEDIDDVVNRALSKLPQPKRF